MSPAKRRTDRKRATKKAAGKRKHRRRAAAKAAPPGPGHNKPDELSTPPPISSWQTFDDGGQVARAIAARQRSFIAETSTGPAGPFALVNDPRTLHEAMLKRIAALEETIAHLPTPGPLEDSEIEESKQALAMLKSLSPTEKPPAEAVQEQTKLKAFGQKVLESLAKDAAKYALGAAASALWAKFGHQLEDLAKAIAEWIAAMLG